MCWKRDKRICGLARCMARFAMLCSHGAREVLFDDVQTVLEAGGCGTSLGLVLYPAEQRKGEKSPLPEVTAS